MKVSRLVVIESVHTTWGRGVISWWLIGKVTERERIWIEKRRREAPWLILGFRCRIQILDLFMTIGTIGDLARIEEEKVSKSTGINSNLLNANVSHTDLTGRRPLLCHESSFGSVSQKLSR
jgi:hypothetical protein